MNSRKKIELRFHLCERFLWVCPHLTTDLCYLSAGPAGFTTSASLNKDRRDDCTRAFFTSTRVKWSQMCFLLFYCEYL